MTRIIVALATGSDVIGMTDAKTKGETGTGGRSVRPISRLRIPLDYASSRRPTEPIETRGAHRGDNSLASSDPWIGTLWYTPREMGRRDAEELAYGDHLWYQGSAGKMVVINLFCLIAYKRQLRRNV